MAIDDPRLDPIWEECGRLGIPVSIHVSDPEAFFHPIDNTNERYEELTEHPDWGFYGCLLYTSNFSMDSVIELNDSESCAN